MGTHVWVGSIDIPDQDVNSYKVSSLHESVNEEVLKNMIDLVPTSFCVTIVFSYRRRMENQTFYTFYI